MEHSIVYAADIGRGSRRVAGLLVFVGSPLGILGLLLFVAVGADTAALTVAVTMGASLVAVVAILFLGHSIGKADWLRLDTHGLEIVRRGENRSWLWSDISRIAHSGPLSPAAAVRGKAILLRVIHDGRGSGQLRPGTVLIGNNYLTPIREIEGTLREIHGRAEGGSRGAVGRRRGQSDCPDMFLDREVARKSAARADGRFRTIVSWVLGIGTASAVALYAVVGWPPDWMALADLLLEFDLITRSIFIGGLAGMLSMAFTDAKGEFLMLSSDGLHQRHHGVRRQWKWRDLCAFELRGGDIDAAAGEGAASATITFLAKGDGTNPKVKRDAPATVFTIDDIYDTPLAEIIRRIEAWHPRADVREFESIA